ncbi:MAG: hypothetical protein AMS23_08455 [Bacteroides sp. SM1_62]|nr:MAG: hypothetical protein AMS26_22295 [Bacteroides sp. SM23_62]KPL22060.1 MAG: hypothetical protein AMS23_08455 [Bacteroides sp. SM1_62]
MINLKKAFRQRPWLFIIVIIYTAGMIAISIPKSREITEDSDHWIIWQAGKDFFNKQELYYRDEIRPFIQPPFGPFLWQPLHAMPLQVSALILFLLNALVLLPLSIYLIYRALLNIGVPPRRAEMALILSTLFTLKYFWNNLVMFQINYLILVFMLGGIFYLSMKKPHIAGIFFTLITFIKIIPVFLAAYVLIFHFSRKVVISMILTALLCLTLPMTTRGWDMWIKDHLDNYEILVRQYILEGRIVADQANHSLKAGLIKTFYPDTRTNENVSVKNYTGFIRAVNVLTILLFLILVINGILLKRRKKYFSLAYLAAILLFTHLFSGITWTAHLVTLIFCLLPVLLIELRTLRTPGKVTYWIFIALMVFLGIEGSDTVGERIYLAIRFYDIYTYLLLGLFIFCSWLVMNRRSSSLYPNGIMI